VELALLCAAPSGSVRHADRIRALSGQPLDWEFLLRFAAEHSVSPLLYWGLKANRPDSIPAALARAFQDNTGNSMALTGELLRLLELFAGKGVSVLPYKGPTLAMSAYGNLALRQFGDLDFLVRKEDALRAQEALLASGFQSGLRLSSRRRKAYLRAYDEFALTGPNGRFLVELHWAVTRRYFSVPLDIQPFWERAAAVPIGNRAVPAPCADDMLLVLCLHAAKHCWTHLSMVSDIAWLAEARDIGWERVLERARGLGAVRMVLLGAELGRRLLDMPLPDAVARRAAADRAVQALAGRVAERMTETPGYDYTILESVLFHMQARERWRDRLRYLARLTTATGLEDWETIDLPPALAFLYALLRFPRLAIKYCTRLPWREKAC
jgi:hypothetical protein